MSTVRVRDTTLYYEQAGRGPALLFIHGMCGDAEVWRGQVARLAHRFTCITYDRRGHTRSPAGVEPESVPTHSADAAALIEALELSRPVVVGSSGGARIAADLVRTRPDVVGGAVLSEPPLFSLLPAAGRELGAFLAAAVGNTVEKGQARAAVDAFFDAVCPGLWSQLDETTRDRYRANGQRMLEELSAPPYPLSADDLAVADTPCLVVRGTASHPALQQIAAELARVLPNARLTQIDGAGHVTYAERPDEFASAVAGLMAELGSGKRLVPTG